MTIITLNDFLTQQLQQLNNYNKFIFLLLSEAAKINIFGICSIDIMQANNKACIIYTYTINMDLK